MLCVGRRKDEPQFGRSTVKLSGEIGIFELPGGYL